MDEEITKEIKKHFPFDNKKLRSKLTGLLNFEIINKPKK